MKKQNNHLSLLNIISLGIGSIIGAGIFALLGHVILLSGQTTYYAFLIAGIAAMFSGYSYSQLAGKYHSAGGLTEYFHVAFPPHWISATLTFIYVLTSAASIAMMAKAFGIYMADVLTKTAHPSLASVNLYAVGIITVLGILNMLKASDVGRYETLFVILKVSILVILVATAVFQPGLMVNPPDIKVTDLNFLKSIGITFFAYTGFEVITNATPYVFKPRKTIERGIYLTITIVMILYISLAYVVINYTPQHELLNNAETAIAGVAYKLLGTSGYAFMFLAAVLAFISSINATFFSVYRITNSLTKQGILPHFFGKIVWRQGNIGCVVLCISTIIATITMDFSSIVNLSCIAYLVSYLGIFAANWKLRRETASSPIIIILGIGITLFILIAFLVSIIY